MHDSQRSMGPFPGEPRGPGNAARAFSGGAPSHPPSGPPHTLSSIDDTHPHAHHGVDEHPPGWRDRTDEVTSMLWLGVALGWLAGLASAGVLWLVVEGLR